MITRAQAEALLTLAESLEACERLGVTLLLGDDFVDICFTDDYHRLQDLDGKSIRVALRTDRLKAKGVF